MTGKQKGAPRAEHGLGYSVVSELSSNHRSKHHHIVLDNAFTSPVLCHDLYRYDIYVTGTARVHRKACLYLAAQLGYQKAIGSPDNKDH
jgi:hypothetical protein